MKRMSFLLFVVGFVCISTYPRSALSALLLIPDDRRANVCVALGYPGSCDLMALREPNTPVTKARVTFSVDDQVRQPNSYSGWQEAPFVANAHASSVRVELRGSDVSVPGQIYIANYGNSAEEFASAIEKPACLMSMCTDRWNTEEYTGPTEAEIVADSDAMLENVQWQLPDPDLAIELAKIARQRNPAVKGIPVIYRAARKPSRFDGTGSSLASSFEADVAAIWVCDRNRMYCE